MKTTKRDITVMKYYNSNGHIIKNPISPKDHNYQCKYERGLYVKVLAIPKDMFWMTEIEYQG